MQDYSRQLSTVNPLNTRNVFHVIESEGGGGGAGEGEKETDVVSPSVRGLEKHNKVEN